MVREMGDTDYAPGQRVLDALDHREPDVPPENLRAMWETFREHCRY